MDLLQRLREIDKRLYTLETVSRLRSASISEGTTEFVGDGTLTIEDGGTFAIEEGSSIHGDSWELGVNDDGTSYVNAGDVLLKTHDADPVTEYITTEAIPISLEEPITKVEFPVPEGATKTIVSGTLNVVTSSGINSVVRVRSADYDISLVVGEGDSISIPLLMEFTQTVAFEIHLTRSESYDVALTAYHQWEVASDGPTE